MTTPTDQHDPSGPVAGPLARAVVRVAGPDALAYLQGQCSQDLDQLAVGTSTWTFVLQPQGKVDAWARATLVAADEVLLDLDPGVDGAAGGALEARLRRFLLRTKADVDLLEPRPAVAVRGDGAPRGDLRPGVLRLPLAGPDGAPDGYDLLGEGAAAPDGTAAVDAAVLEADRILRGVPAHGAELDDGTIPAEVGPWIIEASVSFGKGCYVGQELTARIDSRGGNVPRRLRVLRAEAPVVVGAAVQAGGDEVGVVTSAAVHPRLGPVALAPLRRAVEPGAAVVVDGVAATAHDAPLPTGD